MNEGIRERTLGAKSLGERIATLRRASRRSQTDLAREAGIDAATLNRIERGHRRNPSIATLTAIARALGVELTELQDPHVPLRVGLGTEGPLQAQVAELVELALADLRLEIREVLSVARDGRSTADKALAAVNALDVKVSRLGARRGRRSA